MVQGKQMKRRRSVSTHLNRGDAPVVCLPLPRESWTTGIAVWTVGGTWGKPDVLGLTSQQGQVAHQPLVIVSSLDCTELFPLFCIKALGKLKVFVLKVPRAFTEHNIEGCVFDSAWKVGERRHERSITIIPDRECVLRFPKGFQL